MQYCKTVSMYYVGVRVCVFVCFKDGRVLCIFVFTYLSVCSANALSTHTSTSVTSSTLNVRWTKTKDKKMSHVS